MTEENQKILYEHFVRTGQTGRAQEILKAYPHFEKKPKEKTKSKKEK